jgi:type IV pilus assembly protein PilY1
VKNIKRKKKLNRYALSMATAALLALVTTAPTYAGQLALSDAPLLTRLGVLPNVFVSIDDSSSMKRNHAPADISQDNAADKCTRMEKLSYEYYGYNGLYYNPHITYELPLKPDGTQFPTPTFTSAWDNGFDSASSTHNLNTGFRPFSDGCTSPPTTRGWYTVPIAAVGGDGATFKPIVDDTIVLNDSNFTKVTVSAAEEQNFAIWYSYYADRTLTTKSAISRAFAPADNIRIAYQRINSCNSTDGPAGFGDNPTAGSGTTDPINYCPGTYPKTFGAGLTAKTEFYNWIFATDPSGSTPNKEALYRAGEYLKTTGIKSPWAENPGVSQGTEYSCRQNFHILFTDGMWSSGSGVGGDQDETAVTLPDGKSYTPGGTNQKIYPGLGSDSLSDNTWYYWATDLRAGGSAPALANDVPPYFSDTSGTADENYWNPVNDPATWQHMVQYIVILGSDGGTLDNPADYPALLAGTKSWPDIASGQNATKADDNWHATINARGKYVNASDPDALQTAFTTFLNDISARTSSNAAVALNSGTLDANSRLYQARFKSGSWTGQLLAFALDTVTGAVVSPEVWDAAALLDTKVAGTGWDNAREVITYDGTQGISFRWGSLSGGMQSDLGQSTIGVKNGSATKRLEYLRGSADDEGTSGNKYRTRPSKLGDIVDSSPAYVGDPAFNYDDGLESQPYSSFKSASSGRTAMIYVGANDGMLHGFDAATGQEKIAYIPKVVFPKLPQLLSTTYAHRFYVDGTPTTGDAFYDNGSGAAWHTVLVGGLRKGGQGIYALDVTNPANFSESNAASLVLWEFTDANNADLGYTYSRPAIVRMKNGKWAAVFGNGYNNTEADGNASSTGHAALFIVDIADGSIIKEIDTGAGSVATPNGLGHVAPVDVNGDRIIDYVYAGDLLGNLWKFDVSDANPTNWAVAYGGSPLFVAMDASNVRQPITTQPEVGPHPTKTSGGAFNDGGYMIYFGTGKYLEDGDNASTGTQTQTFYGIWDPNLGSAPSYSRSKLLQQQILKEAAVSINGVDGDVRITSDNAISWAADPLTPGTDHIGWYMDLVNTEGGNTDPKGERQVTVPVLRNGRIIFTTLIPTGSSCLFGGDGWIMELDAADGSRLGAAPFDIDGDGTFDLVDDGTGTFVAPGGLKSTSGAPTSPGILTAGSGKEYKYVSGTAGSVQTIGEQAPAPPSGGGARESWQQLR